VSENQQPSLGLNPAVDDTLAGAFAFILKKFLQNIDGMLPCVVVAADDERKFATVRPQIMVKGTDGELTTRAQLASVPIFHIGAGQFVLTFPVKPGDAGWIVASDRDISLYIQSGEEAAANTDRLHKFSDGLFIPDAARKFTLDPANADRVVLQSLDGSVYVALSADSIFMKAPTKVRMETPLVEMTGDLTVDGTVRGKTDVLSGSGNISGKTHHHTGVTTGGGNSGGPAN